MQDGGTGMQSKYQCVDGIYASYLVLEYTAVLGCWHTS